MEAHEGKEYLVTLTADDSISAPTTTQFQITVNFAPDSPGYGTITKLSLHPISFTIAAFTDLDNHTVTYTSEQSDGSALPTGLSFDASTRTYSATSLSA